MVTTAIDPRFVNVDCYKERHHLCSGRVVTTFAMCGDEYHRSYSVGTRLCQCGCHAESSSDTGRTGKGSGDDE